MHITFILIDSSYDEISKAWRASFSTRSSATNKFCDEILRLNYKINPTLGLNPIMKSINSALISPKHKKVLWKFVNRGLFVGAVGYNYLTNIKKVPPTDTARSISNFCIYSHLITLTHHDPS